jgi:hypothetical protein
MSKRGPKSVVPSLHILGRSQQQETTTGISAVTKEGKTSSAAASFPHINAVLSVYFHAAAGVNEDKQSNSVEF